MHYSNFVAYFKNSIVFLVSLTLIIGIAIGFAGNVEALEVEVLNSIRYHHDAQFPKANGFVFQDVSWITLSPSGNEIYMLQRGVPAVSIWDLQGNLLRSWNTKELGDPHSLSFQQLKNGSLRVWITDMAGPLLAGDKYGHCLKQFDLEGNYLDSIGTCAKDSQGNGLDRVQFDKVTDVAFDSKGYLWVTDGDINGLNNRVLQIEPSGMVMQVWSAPYDKPGSGEKEFNLPHDIDIDPCDRVWLADTLNHRVQVITTSGTFLQELPCFGSNGVYGISVKESPSQGSFQLFTTSSSISSPTGGTVKVFDVSSQCNAPLPVPNHCITASQWPVTLPQGTSERLLHMIDASLLGEDVYITPLGGDLAPLKWVKVDRLDY